MALCKVRGNEAHARPGASRDPFNEALMKFRSSPTWARRGLFTFFGIKIKNSSTRVYTLDSRVSVGGLLKSHSRSCVQDNICNGFPLTERDPAHPAVPR